MCLVHYQRMTEFSDQEKTRRQRRQDLLASGVDVYPARFDGRQPIADILTHWKDGETVIMAGRVRAIRVQGGSAFLRLEDESGELQVFLQKKELEQFSTLTKQIDLGDFLGISGQTFVTKRGERTVDVRTVTWLSKALRPLPSAWHGLADVETRFRYRELDLIMSDDVRQVFRARSATVQAMREFLDGAGFMEVETPMLHPIVGGANAKPFTTHHAALHADLYLRIAPELYLKRLIVGGLGRVYEIGRNFRNEGIDRDHNPEFTMMECYASFTDYRWMMELTEKMLAHIAKRVLGTTTIPLKEGTVDLTRPLPRLSYQQLFQERLKLDIETASETEFVSAMKHAKIDTPEAPTRPKLIDELFKSEIRPTLIEPVFVIDYPTEMIPLAKKKLDNPNFVECFQLLMNGTEVTKGFSELNDPIDQRERFNAQQSLRETGDDEAQPIDETYLRSLEYGMPPTSGLGIGIDRLTAILTGQKTLKDVILFPTLKPEPNDAS